jgi:catechol 2,3-dioxygenase-like lactoylglutathione lyase family enzyme
MHRIISGIQQIGVGIPNVEEAWKWYRQYFNMDVAAFDDEGMAELMLPYTGGQPHERRAVLALNMKGGGGFEIWQYKSRKPEAAKFEILLGDLGICVVKIKTDDIEKTYQYFKSEGLNVSDTIYSDPSRTSHFFVKDPYGNVFQLTKNNIWFQKNKDFTGGADGAIIGVTNIENSIRFYKEILGYDKIIYDTQGKQEDFGFFAGGKNNFRRVLLTHSNPRLGAFSKLLGDSKIELVQVLDRQPKKIFENRFWGDLGFIHICFDVAGMESFSNECANLAYPFTVDSRIKTKGNSFDMGEAAGDFAYVEDPDGTLIELVEAHKLPLVKKLGWNLNLKKRDRTKSLPNWMVKMLSLKRVKD